MRMGSPQIKGRLNMQSDLSTQGIVGDIRFTGNDFVGKEDSEEWKSLTVKASSQGIWKRVFSKNITVATNLIDIQGLNGDRDKIYKMITHFRTAYLGEVTYTWTYNMILFPVIIVLSII